MNVEVHLNRATANGTTYWRAVWTDHDSKRQVRGLGPTTKVTRAEAIRQCRIIERNSTVKRGTLGEFVDVYLASMDVSDQVRANRKRVLDMLVEQMGEHRVLSTITRERADEFCDWLKARTVRKMVKRKMVEVPVDPNTVATQAGIVRMFFHKAKVRELVAFNPFEGVKVKKVKKDHRTRLLTNEEVRAILGACPSPEWRCMFALTYYAGLRAGEALRVKWGDVDWKACVLGVNSPDEDTPTKAHTTKSHERKPPISPELMAELQDCYDQSKGFGPCDGVSGEPSRLGKVIVKRSGVRAYGPVFQALRRMRVTIWQEKFPALAVAHWLGHDVVVAAKHYYSPSPEMVAAVAHASERDTKVIQTQPTKNPTS